MRRRLSTALGLATLGVLVAGALIADNAARDLRELQQLREQGDRVRLTGPHGPPELVPPRAPGPPEIA